MKRFICILLTLLITAVSFAEIKWMTKNELETFHFDTLTVTAGAIVDTKDEVIKLCKLDKDLDSYTCRYLTLESPSKVSKYRILFMFAELGSCVGISHYTKDSYIVESYFIHN